MLCVWAAINVNDLEIWMCSLTKTEKRTGIYFTHLGISLILPINTTIFIDVYNEKYEIYKNTLIFSLPKHFNYEGFSGGGEYLVTRSQFAKFLDRNIA